MKKEEILKQLEELTKQVKALADEKTAFEVGKWYWQKSKYQERGILFNFQKDESAINFGFNSSGVWSNAIGCFREVNNSELIPATEEEIKTALVKEAEKRGYKLSVAIKSFYSLANAVLNSAAYRYADKWEYRLDIDSLFFHGFAVYQQGQWAEIIKNEPLKVAGYEVKIYEEENCPPWMYPEKSAEINGVKYAKEDLEFLVELMKRDQIKSLNVGCQGQHKVTKEDIQKIIDGFKS